MKKTLIAVLFAALALPVFAAGKGNVVMTSSKSNVAVGTQFTVALSAAPAGNSVYTSEVGLSYPSDLVEAVSFSFAPTWLALSQPGYDTMDNAKGSLVKTAGYPGGFSSTLSFGTVTFRAKKAGTAVIALTSDTHLYDANNADAYSGAKASVQVVIAGATAPTPAPAPAPVPSTGGTSTGGTTATTPKPATGTTSGSTTIKPAPAPAPAPAPQQTAQVASSGVFAKTPWFAAAVAAILALLGYGAAKIYKK